LGARKLRGGEGGARNQARRSWKPGAVWLERRKNLLKTGRSVSESSSHSPGTSKKDRLNAARLLLLYGQGRERSRTRGSSQKRNDGRNAGGTFKREKKRILNDEHNSTKWGVPGKLTTNEGGK